jgi:hypothetical protein
MELFPGEFFQGIPVSLEHIHTLLHLLDFLLILLDLSFLTLDLETGLSPMYPGVAWADNPYEYEYSCTECHKNPEILVLTLEYVT